MIWILYNRIPILNLTFLVFFWVINFLSGFGLILNIAIAFEFIFEKIKGNKNKFLINLLIGIQIIITIIIIVYIIQRMYTTYINEEILALAGVWEEFYDIFDVIIFLYGIISLLLTLYIIPLLRNKFDEAINQGRLMKLKKSMKELGRSFKKKYFSLRSKYAKAQLQDQISSKELLKIWQKMFAIFFLIPSAIAAFLFTPVAFILAVFWAKIFIFDKSEIRKYEKIGLLCSMISIGFFACLTAFITLEIYVGITEYFWTLSIFYLIGVIVASFLFIKKIS
jgi:hypothetical protein